MKRVADKITLSPTDLSNHLGCRHVTELNRDVALGKRKKPIFKNLSLEALAERGLAHEKSYVEYLRGQGKNVVELPEHATVADTIHHMQAGVDVIVQAYLSDDDWNGRADLLLKVHRPSDLGSWSYEVADTKLAVDTKAGTILQLSVYSEIITEIQGIAPEYMYVVKPGNPFEEEQFRYDDFKAYYRRIKGSLLKTIADGPQRTYPEPVEQCSICRWWKECDKTRRDDDHLSLVAGIRKMHIGELNKYEINKLEQFANLDKPLPQRPERGHIESYIKVHDQAKIQLKGRGLEKPLYELLEIAEKKGFNRLPEPDAGDLYFDFEGDPYYQGGGLEYLFGIVYQENGQWTYKAFWALDHKQERKAYDEFMRFIIDRWARYPGMHIYHYAPYEPSAIKRLMTRHALHEIEVDKILRGGRFVDLYSISKEILRASVETYSIKYLEKLADFTRKCDLDLAGPARRTLEYTLEFKSVEAVDPTVVQVVEEYNQDDCYATLALHTWLEKIRDEEILKGANLTRPALEDGEGDEKTTQRREELKKLYEEIVADINGDPLQRTEEEKARWLMAHLIHYFDREEKNVWWEFFHVHDMDTEDLYDEKSAIAGLTFLEEIPKTKKQRNVRYKYSFPAQEVDLEEKATIHEVKGDKLGTLESISLEDRTLVISQSSPIKPSEIHGFKYISPEVLEKSLIEVIREFKTTGILNAKKFKAARDLLLQRAPDFKDRVPGEPLIKDETTCIERAIEIALNLNDSVLAIQGPPGTGKTYTGAKIILALIKAGKKIGVTAVSHKVIRNLLDKVHEFAEEENLAAKITLIHKTSDETAPAWITAIDDKPDAIDAIAPWTVLGATSFLWADTPEETLDYLFVDEAGQMSLANVLAASRATHNLILLGDPQQLEQPQKGAHPEGADVAALTHLMGGKQTIAPDSGIFLGTTHRLHPAITRFTSEVYYENRLHSKPELEKQRINGDTPFSGAGLFYVPVTHRDRQTKSEEEVAEIKRITQSLLKPGVTWTNRKGETKAITPSDILIVAPYNAQVKALTQALPGMRIGTVDKFQGQEAAIVIYSVTCSSAEDAPRGMEFLYSPNRLNVATSRAQAACILVASPRVFEAECRSIEQMRWVNGMCRYKELANA